MMLHIIVGLSVVLMVMLLIIVRLSKKVRIFKKCHIDEVHKNIALEDKFEKKNMELAEYKYFLDIFKQYPYCYMLDIYENQDGQRFAVMVNQEIGDIEIFFVCSENRRSRNYPKVDATIYTEHIFINGICAIDENRGTGSMLINYLFRIAKDLPKIKYIAGKLANTDSGNFDKLIHFYEKNGYIVTFSDDKSEGLVKKYIDRI